MLICINTINAMKSDNYDTVNNAYIIESKQRVHSVCEMPGCDSQAVDKRNAPVRKNGYVYIYSIYSKWCRVFQVRMCLIFYS